MLARYASYWRVDDALIPFSLSSARLSYQLREPYSAHAPVVHDVGVARLQRRFLAWGFVVRDGVAPLDSYQFT